jgi:dicarboxylate/amino acid:cation (Na+ or H+) symporter, DAACS family
MMDTGRGMALPTQILLGLTVGAVAGLIAHATLMPSPGLESAITNFIEPCGKIFLRLIFMVVIPLIVSAIILGVAEMGDLRKLGRIGGRCLILTVLLAGTSVVIGLGLTNFFQPGASLPEAKRTELVATYGGASATAVEQGSKSQPLVQTLLNLIPQNPLAEAANAFTPNYVGGGILAVMVFALLFGVALGICPAEQSKPVIDFMRGIFAASLTINGWAMRLAPFGVACLIFSVVARLGFDLLQTLGAYILIVIVGLLLHLLGTYSLALKFLARTSPLQFFRQFAPSSLRPSAPRRVMSRSRSRLKRRKKI